MTVSLRWSSLLVICALWFCATVAASPVIEINTNDHKQTIDGFGVSAAFRQAENLRKFYKQPQQQAIMDLLFDRQKGIGLSIVRSCVGSGGTWGIEIDGPDGTIQPEPGKWVWDSDAYQIWFATEAKKRGVTRFTASCWSPPYWMKKNKSVLPGHIDPAHYDDFARYLAEYVKGYAKRFGIDTSSLSISNEPNQKVGYSGTDWTGPEMTKFVKEYLGPEFARQNIKTKIMVAEAPSWKLGLAEDVLADPVARDYVGIVCTHHYGDTMAYPLQTYGKPLWMTEVSNMKENDSSIGDGLSWAIKMHNFFTNARGNAWCYWWGFCFKDGENHPNSGESLIYLHVDRPPSYSLTKRLWTMGNYSRFIRPGWKRVSSSANSSDGIYLSAFAAPDNEKLAIVVVNDNSDTKTLSLKINDMNIDAMDVYVTDVASNLKKGSQLTVANRTVTAKLPARSVVTLYGTAGSRDDITDSRSTPQTLQGAYKHLFKIGAAVSGTLPDDLNAAELELVRDQFGVLTPANCMKMRFVQTRQGQFDFQAADAFMAFAEKYDKEVCGHNLIWVKDRENPKWLYLNGSKQVTRKELLKRMKVHIHTVVGRYRGRIKSWDVVNEVLADSDEDYMHTSKYVDIIGEDFVAKAFEYAHQADPDAMLIYNDYNLFKPGKREKLVRLLTGLIAKNVPVHAVGFQGHWQVDEMPYEGIEATIKVISDLGLKVMISELDMDMVPRGMWWAEDGKYRDELSKTNPYPDFCPEELLTTQAREYARLFTLLVKYADKVERITFWNIHDGRSWLNHFPWDRTNYPLLFDRNAKAKPAFKAVLDVTRSKIIN